MNARMDTWKPNGAFKVCGQSSDFLAVMGCGRRDLIYIPGLQLPPPCLTPSEATFSLFLPPFAGVDLEYRFWTSHALKTRERHLVSSYLVTASRLAGSNQ